MQANPNSKARADDDNDYVPIDRPEDPGAALDALNLWAYYLSKWGQKVKAKHDDLERQLKELGQGSAATHLDPPPEPFK